MREPIEERGGHLRVAEHGAPLAEGEIGGHDERDALIELTDQVEEQRTAILRERQVAELIEDDDVLVEEPRGQATGLTLALLGVELVNEIDDAEEARAFPLLDGVPGESCRQVRFPGAGAADEHDVAGGGEVLPGVELADLRLAHHRLAEVEAIEVARNGEVGEAQLVLIGTRLAISDLSCEQLPQPVSRSELLLAQRRQALLQRTRHAAQAQGFQLFDQLGLHRGSPSVG